MFRRAIVEKRAFTVCCIALAAAVCTLLLVQLARDQFLRGFDAYYYAVQADSLVRTGQLKIPDSSIVHYFIAALQYCGLETETAVRVWTALSLLVCYSILALLLRRCASRSIAFFLFSWALVSPSLLFIALEFPKHFSFIILLPAWFLCIRDKKIHFFSLACFIVLSLLLHKSSVVYSVIVLLACILYTLTTKKRIHHRAYIFPTLFVLLCIIAYCGISLDALHSKDILRIKGLIITPGLLSLLLEKNLPLFMKIEILLSLLTFCIVAAMQRKDPARLILPIALLLTVFMPAFGEEAFNFGQRLAVLTPFLALLGCAFLLRDTTREFFPRGGYVALGLLALCFGAARLYILYPPERLSPLASYQLLTRELTPQNIPMLVVHRGMHFYYKFASKNDAFSFEPEGHWDKTRIWRLAFGITSEEWQAYLPAHCGRSSGLVKDMPFAQYTLVREDCYAALRSSVREDYNPELYELLWRNAMNPATARPQFLYKKHKSDKDEEFPALAP